MVQKNIYLDFNLQSKCVYQKSVVTALAEVMMTGVNPATQQVDAPRRKRLGEICQGKA